MISYEKLFTMLPGGDNVALTDAQRRASNKYAAQHMTVLGCKVRKEYAEQVKQKAQDTGTTVNAILKKALDDFMEK